MNITKTGLRGILTGRVATACAAAVAIGTALAPQNAEAVYNYQYGDVYQQDFNGLGTGNTNTNGLNQGVKSTGRNDWFGTALEDIQTGALATNGSTVNPTGFLNLGATGDSDRAYGYSGSTRFVGVEFVNNSQDLDQFTIEVDLEVWRRPTSGLDGRFELQYIVSDTPLTSLDDVNAVNWQTIHFWTVPSGLPDNDPADPVFSDTTYKETITFAQDGFMWDSGSYLYFRLDNINSGGGYAGFDNMTFSAVPEPSTWVAGGLLLGFAAFTQFRRRKATAEVAA